MVSNVTSKEKAATSRFAALFLCGKELRCRNGIFRDCDALLHRNLCLPMLDEPATEAAVEAFVGLAIVLGKVEECL